MSDPKRGSGRDADQRTDFVRQEMEFKVCAATRILARVGVDPPDLCACAARRRPCGGRGFPQQIVRSRQLIGMWAGLGAELPVFVGFSFVDR